MSTMVFTGIDFPNFQNVSVFRGKVASPRSKLIRSTGSFSVVEDNIVAPTPRKIPSVASSPTHSRKSQRKSLRAEESLFGEACMEVQTILLTQSPPSTPKAQSPDNVFECDPAEIYTLLNRSSSPSCVCASPPPLRAANPLPLNSPFLGNFVEVQPADSKVVTAGVKHTSQLGKSKQKARYSRAAPRTRPLRELNVVQQEQQPDSNGSTAEEAAGEPVPRTCQTPGRMRSKSWPVLPTVVSS